MSTIPGSTTTAPVMGVPITTPSQRTILYPAFPGLSQAVADASREYPLRSSDVVLVAYPKTGTTWTQMILHLLLNRGVHQPSKKDPSKPMSPFEAAPWITARLCNEPNYTETHASDPAPRIYSEHSTEEMTPSSTDEKGQAKFVYVVRNPLDTIVSFFYHTRSKSSYDGDFEDFFGLFLNEQLPYGSFFDHVLDWHQAYAAKPGTHPRAGAVHWMRYEDMTRNPLVEITKLASFLGLSLTPEELKLVVTNSTFRNMADKMVCEPVKPRAGEAQHMRKGMVGDWRHHFTEDQLTRFRTKYATQLARFQAEQIVSVDGESHV